MANNINLSRFKASGVYTIEVDASATVTVTPPVGRLIIGSSKKGPINTAVQIRNVTQAKQVFGEVDRQLENKGSYFHRGLNTMLSEGDVYAMNIMPIDLTNDDTNLDQSYITTLNTESATKNETYAKTPIKNIYNRQKFWYPSEEELTRTKNNEYVGGQANKILSFANLGKKPVTIFVQRANISGFDVTVEEWYSGDGNNEIPTFVDNEDFISDYMVDIIVVEGQWSDYLRLSQDPVYFKYFNEAGLKTNMINEFLALSAVKQISRVQGCLIPEFVDKTGNNIAIDRVFNNLFPLTEMICALDEDKLAEIELDPDSYEGFDDDVSSTHRVDIIGHGYEDLTESLIDDHDNILIDTLSYKKPSSKTFVYDETDDDDLPDSIIVDETGTYTVVKAYEDSLLYKAYKYGFLKNNDINKDTTTSPETDIYINIVEGKENLSGTETRYIIISGNTSPGTGSTNIAYETVLGTKQITFDNSQDEYSKEIDLSIFDSVTVTNNTITLDTTNVDSTTLDEVLEFVKPGYYLKAEAPSNQRGRILRILSVAKSTEGSIGSPGYSIIYTIKTMVSELGVETENNTKITAYVGIHNFTDELKGQYLPEFKVREGLLPNGTAARQQTIMKYISDTNLGDAIAEAQGLDIRHIVDSYEGEIASSSKFYLTDLAASHGKVMAFVNNPSIEQFEKSNDPSFIDSSTGLVSMEYVAQGGNLSLNPSFTFSLPQDVTQDGIPIESYAYYAMPYVVVRENSKNKKVPPAPYLSNLFMRKLNGGNQYGIAAGRRGILTEPEIVGLEYEFTDAQREYLEPVGHNLLVRRRGIGTMVLSNNTAYQKVQSALNNAHVRDTLITIENNVEDILFNFLFSFNDEITRIRVRSLLENYLDDVQSARGLTSYEVQFDDQNNPNEVIEENTGIVDILVDFPRGIHKFINRITITRVGGGISTISSGFLPV